MTVNLSQLTAKIQNSINWTAAINESNLPNPSTNQNATTSNYSVGNGTPNNQPGGGDELLYQVVTLLPSASASINLQNFTDIMNQSGASFARVKGWKIQNLSLAQGGQAASSIVIGGGSNPFGFTFGTVSNTYTLYNGDSWQQGSTLASGYAVAGSNNAIKILNSDSINPASGLVCILGGSS